MKELFQLFDKDNNEVIEFDEFVAVFLQVSKKQEMVDWMHSFVDACADAILSYDNAIEHLFRELDDENIGSLNWEGFWIVLQALARAEPELALGEMQGMQLFNLLDHNKDGRVDYNEFMCLAHPTNLQIF